MNYYLCQCGCECNDEERVFDYKLDKYVCPHCGQVMFEDYTREEQMQVLENAVVTLKALVNDIEKGINNDSPYIYGYEVTLEKVLKEMEGIY